MPDLEKDQILLSRFSLLEMIGEGGMGIVLVKSLTDEQNYRRDGDHNVFTVTKNYNQ